MEISNVLNTVVEIADIKDPSGGSGGVKIPALSPSYKIFNEDAERSIILAQLLTAGSLVKVSDAEPSASPAVDESQNQKVLGSAIISTGAISGDVLTANGVGGSAFLPAAGGGFANPAVVDLDMSGFKINNVMDPASAQDAATKAYVDASGGGGFSIIASDKFTFNFGEINYFVYSSSTTESIISIIIPRAGTIRRLFAKASSNGLDSDTFIEVLKNGAATNIELGIGPGALTGSDLVKDIAVSAGDTLSFTVDTTDSSENSIDGLRASVEVV